MNNHVTHQAEDNVRHERKYHVTRQHRLTSRRNLSRTYFLLTRGELQLSSPYEPPIKDSIHVSLDLTSQKYSVVSDPNKATTFLQSFNVPTHIAAHRPLADPSENTLVDALVIDMDSPKGIRRDGELERKGVAGAFVDGDWITPWHCRGTVLLSLRRFVMFLRRDKLSCI